MKENNNDIVIVLAYIVFWIIAFGVFLLILT